MPTSAEETSDLLEINLQGSVLTTEFSEQDAYYIHESHNSHETVDIFDLTSGEKLASLELNYANPLSRAESVGEYKKYLSDGLTIVHSFGFSYTTSGTSKIVTAVLWDRISTDGWSFFTLDGSTGSANKYGIGTISGSYSATIKATIDGQFSVTAEYKRILLGMAFGGEITIGSTYTGTKTFIGSWKLSVNPNPGCTTSMCPARAN